MQSEIRSRNSSNLYISLPIPRGYADRGLKHISKLNKLPSSEVRSSSVHLLSLSQSKVKHVGLNLFGLSSSFSHSDSDTAASPNPFYLSLLRALNRLSKQSKGGRIQKHTASQASKVSISGSANRSLGKSGGWSTFPVRTG